jgi:hypothetical protein
MNKVVKSLFSVACVLLAAAAAGKAEAAVHVNVSIGGPVVKPKPAVVVHQCPAPSRVVVKHCPRSVAHCHHLHLPRHRHCAPKPPCPASHAHKVPVHRHPVPRCR